MNTLSCLECQERAAELALGVLAGLERAEVLGHLQTCNRCQSTVTELAATANRLAGLLPEIDPPEGFDQRVLDAINPPEDDGRIPGPRTARERTPMIIALPAIAVLVAGVAFGLAGSERRIPNGPPVAAGPHISQRTLDLLAAPVMADRRRIGTAYILPRTPVWVVVSLSGADTTPNDPTDDTVSCDLVRHDGSTVELGSFPLRDGHADWATPTQVDADTLAGAHLTARVGHTVGSAAFASSGVDFGAPDGPTLPAPVTTEPATTTALAKPGKQPKDPKSPESTSASPRK